MTTIIAKEEDSYILYYLKSERVQQLSYLHWTATKDVVEKSLQNISKEVTGQPAEIVWLTPED